MVPRAGAARRAGAQREDTARPGVEDEVRGSDAKQLRFAAPVERLPSDVDDHALRSDIAHFDRFRRRCDQSDPGGRHGEPNRRRDDHRASTVNVTVAA